ncbi:aminotransferase class I/II-fold pyridoxal phosphate-dependent enzyme [Sulfitobacter geojensis]|uniref:Aminotransferase class I/II-fold pyridoxal phosphate-dependent enzyme n=1 Tax=Sulfitobacter geojensis TaxID=1342299 RepID=A0AAE2VWT2_9RHOB|nr:aminotransferase class I/II-fold pyridoxal phosphate-dependent enzyme [Sulfitobacter geojensis]MBM1688799.1 aminotransferase class I/II-fold pyridoxal phosphate-dependent enzyme [Sulfitobacter geojensis]MBM1692866.1 aminotransferase class I/II-fold pyridoxal phosphate-dependent enzyme [Sulfitobacter geojensis]MBM1705032.1 aminotransferase class I/II-fold pyridoxal phosphate-dependent enzyme [Sulfitobacter geojensis]MBM1709090.1 aminotransferase class I/II-fold pyridoxal phosphate-dependent e
MDSVSDYYSATQLRADRWSALRESVTSLCRETHAKKAAALKARIDELFSSLALIEPYWAFPGMTAFDHMRRQFEHGNYEDLAFTTNRVKRALTTGAYRRRSIPLDRETSDDEEHNDEAMLSPEARAMARPYFEVLIVDNVNDQQERWLKSNVARMRRPEDPFHYEAVVVPSLEDALIAVLFNHNIQAIVVRPGLVLKSNNDNEILAKYIRNASDGDDINTMLPEDYGPELCRLIARVRPELDAYLVTERSVEDIAGLDLGICRRVFYNQEDFMELHLNILRGVAARSKTPFFTALVEYSKQPTGVFHAMPISRGKSITRSHWIQDMGAFYGPNIFLAETSATSGGLDSLLEPQGPIKEAQELASRAFGSKQTFFATNGTSTCNKIVVQAVVRPGDIVLVDRDCHKSHHYGMVLAGAEVVYLDSYPLNEYSMYGAVPLKEIKHQLLALKAAGKLDRVRMLLLTNCTFDGLVYNVERVMEECLAIKPDLVFLWDEAWFAFARFSPTYRQRTGMRTANNLRKRLRTEDHKRDYELQQLELEGASDETLVNTRLIAPPDARIRVYATQSTHKTLTSLRQGSMIHVNDQDFKGEVEQSFHEAYMTHTSTSPNYQIIASLDVGRRQVELEGFEFVQRQIEAAMSMRKAISSHPMLQKYFKVLTAGDMIPEHHRQSGVSSYFDNDQGWTDIWDCWEQDDFVLDATRVTLAVGGTGWDGDTFKTQILMDKYGIQINKTSRNTVLFMTNIGTTRSSVAYLIEVLVEIANELDDLLDDASQMERRSFDRRVKNLTENYPPLPDFSRFHDAFRPDNITPEGDIRTAYYLSYKESNCDYLELDGSLQEALDAGDEVVSAGFIIPYPPGFPILVPGQVVSKEILSFMRALDVSEIHGYRADLGLRVFTADALDSLQNPQKLKPAAE